MKKRDQIQDQYKWAIQDLFIDNEAWQKEYDQVKKNVDEIKTYQGRLGDSKDVLFNYLSFYDQVSKCLERVYVYANQKYHEDTKQAVYQKMSDLAGSLMVLISSATSFATPEILGIPEEKLAKYLSEEPQLFVYQKYLNDILRKRPHILSSEMEELLAQAGEIANAPSNIFGMFNNADIKFPSILDEDGNEVEISHARFTTFLQSKDRRVRKDAFCALYATYYKFKNTLAVTFGANIKQEAFYAKARKYNSSLSMELDESNVPINVYSNLIQTVHNNLDLMYRYIELRKKVLGLDEIHMYDLYTPMVSQVEMNTPYEEAKDLVYKGLEPLGKEYQKIIEEGYQNGWIDVFENEGKRSGAYSWGAYGTHPYVLLNYQDNLNSVFTLAHEMGHAMHSYYSDKTQPYIYAEYKIFVAEVASTCNEALLMHYLLEHTEDKLKKAYLINYHLEQFRTTLYRQTMFAEFEMITHKKIEQGEGLTAESLCEIYHNLNVLYFGDGIVVDSEIDMEWARIPHFYNAFYVYQYATGYSAAIALSRRIIKEGSPALEEYLNFLKGGSSKDPIELLKGAGVDMNTEKPINDALAVFEELLGELEMLLK